MDNISAALANLIRAEVSALESKFGRSIPFCFDYSQSWWELESSLTTVAQRQKLFSNFAPSVVRVFYERENRTSAGTGFAARTRNGDTVIYTDRKSTRLNSSHT